jgi:hypothetical protein
VVEVFKTDVEQVNEANQIIQKLLEHFPECKINFDLDDCDYVLRVEGNDFTTTEIINFLQLNGHFCEILD